MGLICISVVVFVFYEMTVRYACKINQYCNTLKHIENYVNWTVLISKCEILVSLLFFSIKYILLMCAKGRRLSFVKLRLVSTGLWESTLNLSFVRGV